MTSLLEEGHSGTVAFNVELNLPRKVVDEAIVVLMAGNMVESERRWEEAQNGEDLKFDVGFGIEGPARIWVGQRATGVETLDEAFAVGVVFER
jgi:hypothetical protein